MSIEHQIIRLFSRDKQQHQRYSHRIETLTLDKVIKDILKLITRYYSQYPEHSFISQDELINYYDYHYPESKQRSTYVDVIARAYALDTSDSLASDVVKQLMEKDTGNRIINKLLPIVSGEFSPGLIQEAKAIVEEHEALIQLSSEEEESPFVEDDLDTLIESEASATGITWRLSGLNEDIGPHRGGSLGHVFARNDVGKTTFILSEMSHFASQFRGEDCLLYFNNEERGKKLRLRLFCSVLGSSIDRIIANKDKAREAFIQRGGDRIKLRDRAGITINEVETFIKKYKPKIVVIDQGDKIVLPVSKDTSNTDRLQALYAKYRELAKQYNCDIITVGQASAEAHNKQWLEDTWMNNSKTGKPGELDWAIGIGYRDKSEEARYLSIVKNKNGPHGKHPVLFNPIIVRYQDV